jgi:hypothetical protein
LYGVQTVMYNVFFSLNSECSYKIKRMQYMWGGFICVQYNILDTYCILSCVTLIATCYGTEDEQAGDYNFAEGWLTTTDSNNNRK